MWAAGGDIHTRPCRHGNRQNQQETEYFLPHFHTYLEYQNLISSSKKRESSKTNKFIFDVRFGSKADITSL